MSAPGLQGLRPWIIQRITAVYIAVFMLYFTVALSAVRPFSAESWSEWVAWPGNNIGIGMFIIAVLWHAWVGIRDVVLDYVPNVVSRMLVLTLVATVLVGSGFWGFRGLVLVVIK
ncbi:MAG: succinate dehydrogenase, hydrophobic membrane anchor protein [Gammaproteobacteria bacterium]|nr:succinate dehydrogenase, hydrophobic membrane anchor protein [Gammaproteobacteria bacterium]